jgi:hypothetical protein
MPVVVRADGVRNLSKPTLVCGAVGKCVANIHSAVTPFHGEPAALCHGWIVGGGIGGAGVHHDEKDSPVVAPNAAQPVAVFMSGSPEKGGMSRTFHVRSLTLR